MIGLMMQQLGLILQQLKNVSEQIDESLQQKFSRSKDTNTYYEKIKEHLMKLEDQFLNWNTKIMTIMNVKEGTKLETLLEASRNTSEELRKLREKLNVLRDKAETNIAFKNYE